MDITPIPLLIHLPHSSMVIPDKEIAGILLEGSALAHELLRMTDRFTDEIYDIPGAVVHRNRVSRLVFDPERFRDDSCETMAHFGMGAIYSHAENGMRIREITAHRREEMMKEYYDPYHAALEEKTQGILGKFGKCLIIDGHSFPDIPLGFEADKKSGRPDICIGTCDFHTPGSVTARMEDLIRANGMTVMQNKPFAGTLVPMRYYLKDRRVGSVMVEVNRRLYMDEESGGKLPGFAVLKAFIQKLVYEAFHVFDTLLI